MKKLSLKNLKLEASDILQRSELKSVLGGYSGGNCSISVSGAGWSKQNLSIERAQEYYGDGEGDALYTLGGASVTGYCCSSCHKYRNHHSYQYRGNEGPRYA